MKKLLLILTFIVAPFAIFAQDEDEGPDKEPGKLPQRMKDFIENKLNLTKQESEKFTPIFFRYFHEFAKTHRENKGDKLILQQKIVELRIKFRTEFRQVMDERRADRVFVHEDEFRRKALEIIRENRRDRLGKPPRKIINQLQMR